MKWFLLIAAFAAPASAQGLLPHARNIERMQIELRLPPGIALSRDTGHVTLRGDGEEVRLPLHRIEGSRRFRVPAGTRLGMDVTSVTPAFALCATGKGGADALRYRLLRPGIPPGAMQEMRAEDFASLPAC